MAKSAAQNIGAMEKTTRHHAVQAKAETSLLRRDSGARFPPFQTTVLFGKNTGAQQKNIPKTPAIFRK
jgi:hypothetical protein